MAGVSAADLRWLAMALHVAEAARHRAAPNPFVGCVLVRDEALVATGATAEPGGPHAEVVALRAAGPAATGATAYVTLEPCDHTGRTGPCSVALRDAGVARVVVAAHDPSPLAGGGLARLEAAGVETAVATRLAPWASVQQRRWRRVVTAPRDAAPARPWVTLKLAQTTDGATTVPGRRWVTGVVAREQVHALRASHDAVLVGSGTLLADDPRLDVRHVPLPQGRDQPRPVVLDRRARTPTTAHLVVRGGIVLTAAGGDDERRVRSSELRMAGAELVEVAPRIPAADGFDPVDALEALSVRGVGSVLAEPGTTLAGALVDAGVVDEVVLHVADGRDAHDPPRPAIHLDGWEVVEHRPLGPDRAWTYRSR